MRHVPPGLQSRVQVQLGNVFFVRGEKVLEFFFGEFIRQVDGDLVDDAIGIHALARACTQ